MRGYKLEDFTMEKGDWDWGYSESAESENGLHIFINLLESRADSLPGEIREVIEALANMLLEESGENIHEVRLVANLWLLVDVADPSIRRISIGIWMDNLNNDEEDLCCKDVNIGPEETIYPVVKDYFMNEIDKILFG